MAIKPELQQQAKEILNKLPLLGGISDDQITALVSRLNGPKEFAPNKVILMDQEIGKTLYVLIKGNVSVWKRVGGEKMKLATLPAPNFFGERTMFEESPASALVKAEDACSVFTLDRSDFDQVTAQFPRMTDLIRINMEAVRAQRMGPIKPPTE